MKYIWYLPQKSKYSLCIKIDKPSGLQIFGKRYEMTLLTSRIWQNPNVFTTKILFQNNFYVI